MRVKVRFPDGDREVSAHVNYGGGYGDDRAMGFRGKITPDDMPGYRFMETITGEWFAAETYRD